MRATDRIRAAWSDLTKSPTRTAAAVAGVLAALALGVGYGLAVDAVRNEGIGRDPAASPSVTSWPSSSADPTPTLIPWETSAQPRATATATPAAVSSTPDPTLMPTPPPTPAPTPDVTPQPLPTARPTTAGCDRITVDIDGVVFVNGERVENESEVENGEQMPMAVLRLAARATGVTGSTVCLHVELPSVVVSGSVELCGNVVSQRRDPLPTPSPADPGDPMAPRYGEPTISGVQISDRMLDMNSYPLLDIADRVDVPACFHVAVASNDVHTTLSLAICESVRLTEDGTMTIFVGDDQWLFSPEYVFDDAGVLPIGELVTGALDMRNYLDDVIHQVEMAVWVSPGCPWAGQ